MVISNDDGVQGSHLKSKDASVYISVLVVHQDWQCYR